MASTSLPLQTPIGRGELVEVVDCDHSEGHDEEHLMIHDGTPPVEGDCFDCEAPVDVRQILLTQTQHFHYLQYHIRHVGRFLRV